jgi:hypothetical protein
MGWNMRDATAARLQSAHNRRRRRESRPAVARLLSDVGLTCSFLADAQQDEVLAKFRDPTAPKVCEEAEFHDPSEALHWVSARLEGLPSPAIIMPNNDLGAQPAFLADPARMLDALRRDLTLLSLDGCFFLAPDGTRALEVFPNHTDEGDVVTVWCWRAAP